MKLLVLPGDGIGPDIAGFDKANPTSMILSVAMLLRWPGERKGDDRYIHAATLIESEIDLLISQVSASTGDLAGPLGTKAFSNLLIGAMDEA